MTKRLLPFACLCLPVALAAQAPEAPAPEPWSLHAQLTYQLQGHGGFTAPYEGDNSLQDRREVRGSYTTTFFVGRRLWEGTELYTNAEAFAGAGVSRVLGLAAPPNGETYRVDSTTLKVGLARLFLRQTWNLGEPTEAVADGPNQVATRQSRRRVVLTAGKLSGTDIFDANTYSHDARTQFNNWSLWANAAWDYPADTRGYTWGVALEWLHDDWALRAGSLMEPREANQLELDHDVRHAHGEVIELEHDYELGGQKGALRLLAFQNHARMGSYGEALALAPAAPDVTATRTPGRAKHGFGLNAEQAVTPDLGLFLRAGWNDGKTESWAFTEVERTLSMGLSASGRAWGRGGDRVGLGFAANGLNQDHRDYLAAGGYGFMVGDGRLAYRAERVLDAYYALALGSFGSFSLEVQRFEHLAFNRDRGPATLCGLRLHLQL
ncbi:carbohydrate porin [Geothrix oryzisoli]|uniref:carbohydrate porin n=1 Tax=Geothrix oryzisoli TaxID=2922721 RepID=UPI001FACC911|nr:carbohydrate porin [Geothrix oryzisoli]